MRICKIQENDIANGEGVRLSLFTQGCFKHCVGCNNVSNIVSVALTKKRGIFVAVENLHTMIIITLCRS